MIDYDNNVCFVHIPKNAGQSVERWFMDLRGLDHSNPEHRRELGLFKNDFGTGLPRANDHLTFAQYRTEVFGGTIPEGMRFFAIVRDPMNRLASELAYRFNGRVAPRQLLALRSVPIQRMFGDFRCHLQTQASFVAGAEPGQITLLRLENLAEDFAAMTQQFGLPDIALPHINHSGDKPRRRRELPESVRAWALETYAEDFDRFGYDVPQAALVMAS